jgi:hypothetical protein
MANMACEALCALQPRAATYATWKVGRAGFIQMPRLINSAEAKKAIAIYKYQQSACGETQNRK